MPDSSPSSVIEEMFARRAAQMAESSRVGIAPSHVTMAEPDPTGSTWTFRDLAPALAGDIEATVPTILRRHDGIALFYAGKVNGLHADSGVGKSLLALLAAVEHMTSRGAFLAARGDVVWIDHEDANESLAIERLRDLGVDDDVIRARFHYVNPDETARPSTVDRLLAEIDRLGRSCLVVIDSTGEALGLNGADENSDLDVDEWARALPKRLEREGHTVILIDHATKAADNPLHPSGSKRKRSMISGSSFLVSTVTPFDREHPGKLKLTCAKDRHGHYRRGAPAAWVHVDPTGDPRLKMLVEAPTESGPSPEDAAPASVALIRKVVAAVDEAGGVPSKNRLRSLIRAKGVHGRNGDIDDAVELAESIGCIRSARAGQSTTYSFVRSVTDDDLGRFLG
jgi:hypothetical protein